MSSNKKGAHFAGKHSRHIDVSLLNTTLAETASSPSNANGVNKPPPRDALVLNGSASQSQAAPSSPRLDKSRTTPLQSDTRLASPTSNSPKKTHTFNSAAISNTSTSTTSVSSQSSSSPTVPPSPTSTSISSLSSASDAATPSSSSASASAKLNVNTEEEGPLIVRDHAVSLVISPTSVDGQSKMRVNRWGKLESAETEAKKDRPSILERDREREMKWVKMAPDFKGFMDTNPKRVKKRIRKGVPEAFRGQIWPQLCHSNLAREQNAGLYEQLLDKEIDREDDVQIRKDLPREQQEHVMFRSPEPGSRKIVGKGQFALYNVLKAYSVHDRSVGYVQGMGSIAALCLMYMPEEDAFWVLERLLNSEPWSLAGLYTKGMPRSLYYLHVHQACLKKHLPRLFAHFDKENVMPSSYAFRWLTTRFTQFPLQTVVRIFEIFLAEGEKMLFRFAIYVLKVRERDLLKLDFEHLTEELNDMHKCPEFEDADKTIAGCLDTKIPHREIKRYAQQYWDEQKQLNGEPASPSGRSHKDKKQSQSQSASSTSRGSEKFLTPNDDERPKSAKKGAGSRNEKSTDSLVAVDDERPKSAKKSRGSEKAGDGDVTEGDRVKLKQSN